MTSRQFTPDEVFEMEVDLAMDEFRITYSAARYAVAERAVVEALVNFGLALSSCDTRR